MEIRMPVYDDPVGGLRVDPSALRRWTTMVVERLGAPSDIAADVAELLVVPDLRGIASHGTARLPQYVKLAEAGVMDPAARPVLERGQPESERASRQRGHGIVIDREHHASLARRFEIPFPEARVMETIAASHTPSL